MGLPPRYGLLKPSRFGGQFLIPHISMHISKCFRTSVCLLI